jgi:hypothetical protein
MARLACSLPEYLSISATFRTSPDHYTDKMRAKVLLIGLVTTALCMKVIIKPEVEESDSKAIESVYNSYQQISF